MILRNTLSCCFEESSSGGGLIRPLLIHYSAFSHTACYYSPSNQICTARANAGLALTQQKKRKGVSFRYPPSCFRTSGWNNSDQSWQRRMSGECTHIWHGAQMSFHLRRTLKGDRLHPSCQADRLDTDMQRTDETSERRSPEWADMLMIHNKCHSGKLRCSGDIRGRIVTLTG